MAAGQSGTGSTDQARQASVTAAPTGVRNIKEEGAEPP